MAVILKCTCKHDYQDKVYGKGMRVHNAAGKGKAHGKEVVCTVCLSKKEHKPQ